MKKKKLTVIHYPTHCEFFSQEQPLTIDRKSYLQHLFRYKEVKLITFYQDYYYVSIRLPFLLKLFSRGKTLVQDAEGKETRVTFLRLIVHFFKAVFRFFKEMIIYKKVLEKYRDQESLINKVNYEITELIFNTLQINFNFTIPPKGSPKIIDNSRPPAYFCTYLGNTIIAGGSVGHIGGVLNNLGNFTLSPLFFTTHRISTVREDIETHHIDPPPKFKYFSELWQMSLSEIFSQKVLDVLTKRPPSFIYQRYYLFNTYGIRISQHFNVPFVLEFNGSEIWVNRNWGKPLLYESLAVTIELSNLFAADLIVVVSKPQRDILVKQGFSSDKILVNPNGVDPDVYSPDVSGGEVRKRFGLEEKTVVGFIGTFGLWHGAEILAEAFGILLNRYPGYKKTVRLLMVGDGLTLPDVKKLLLKHTVADYSILTGLVLQKEGPKYLAAADILVSPHKPNADGSPFFGSPTKLFEYMAMGKGIVASNLDQIGDILEHEKTAWMVKPGNVDELVEGLKMLIDNESLRKRLGESARKEVVAKYTWKEHTRKIIEKLKDRFGR